MLPSGQALVVRTHRVRVPWRLVASPSYPDVALSVFVKVAALAARPEGCQAKASTIAGYLGLSRASVERGLAALSRPAADGVVELATVRRTLRGGRGTSAVRRVRPAVPGEAFVWVPVAAAEDLTPRQLRAYAVIAFAERTKTALTEAELAGYLRHHSGLRAGQPITADAAGAVVDEVEAARWITVQRRAGAHGRHRLLAHDIAPEVTAALLSDVSEEASGAGVTTVDNSSSGAAGSCVGEGSGGVVGEGSLAYKESPRTDSPEDEGAAWSPAVGEVQVGEAVENADATVLSTAQMATVGGGGRGLALRADGPIKSVPTSAKRTRNNGAARPAYDGPQLVLSARVYAVLEPVHGLLAQVTDAFVVRKIGREVGRQLDTGTHPERLQQRLEQRYARVMSEDIRDAGRWLLGVALPRWGCGHQDCEAGVMWTTGKACDVCADVVADRAAERARCWRQREGLCAQHGTRPGPGGTCVDCDLEQAIRYPAPVVREPEGPPRGSCADCGARVFLAGQALVDGLCRPCRALVEPPAAAPAGDASVLCTGGTGEPCGRPALPTRTVCLRHRSEQLAARTSVAAGRGHRF